MGSLVDPWMFSGTIGAPSGGRLMPAFPKPRFAYEYDVEAVRHDSSFEMPPRLANIAIAVGNIYENPALLKSVIREPRTI